MLQDHPVVVGACVVGVPDRKVGERIKAIVVLKTDAKGVGAAELIKFCSERLASYKVPSYIEFRDMLPKSKVGKLLRREIRDEERRKMEKGKKGETESTRTFIAIAEILVRFAGMRPSPRTRSGSRLWIPASAGMRTRRPSRRTFHILRRRRPNGRHFWQRLYRPSLLKRIG